MKAVIYHPNNGIFEPEWPKDYKPIALVEAESLDDAFYQTVSFPGITWCQVQSNMIILASNARRSSTIGDVVVFLEDRYNNTADYMRLPELGAGTRCWKYLGSRIKCCKNCHHAFHHESAEAKEFVDGVCRRCQPGPSPRAFKRYVFRRQSDNKYYHGPLPILRTKPSEWTSTIELASHFDQKLDLGFQGEWLQVEVTVKPVLNS